MNKTITPPTSKRSRLRLGTIIGSVIAAGMAVTVIGCVRKSGKVTYFHEAELPEGWPLLTEVGGGRSEGVSAVPRGGGNQE